MELKTINLHKTHNIVVMNVNKNPKNMTTIIRFHVETPLKKYQKNHKEIIEERVLKKLSLMIWNVKIEMIPILFIKT